MKKITTVFFLIMLISVTCFAEFVITPSIGFSNIISASQGSRSNDDTSAIKATLNTDVSNSWNAFAIGLDLGFIGKKGFTFFLNNNISIAGSNKTKVHGKLTLEAGGVKTEKDIDFEMKTTELKGAFWHGEALFGYTWKNIPNLYITLTGGFGVGFGEAKVNKVQVKNTTLDVSDLDMNLTVFNIGPSFHFGVQYYFTNNIGLAIAVTDTIGFGNIDLYSKKLKDLYPTSSNPGFSNAFLVKLGPTFKF